MRRIMNNGGMIGGLLLTLIVSYATHAQYQTAAGVRVGGTSGFAVRHQFMGPMYGEAIVGSFHGGFSFTGLIEKSISIPDSKGFYAYYGGGGHLAFYNGNDLYSTRFGREVDYHRDNNVAFGINIIGGLVYRLPEAIPIVINIDMKPFIELGSGGYVGFAFDPSIGLKYIFK